tara:strand:- start:1742 stop:2623 length:882 start_codon:yes stop_codon:yes gene_type:complete
MNRLDSQYQNLIDEVLEFGHNKPDRTGVGTKSIFDYTITHCMCDGFPLLTTKKMAVKTMMTELKWFLKGKTNIRPLLFDNCNIWTGDAYKQYKNVYDYDLDDALSKEEFVTKIKEDYSFSVLWGDLGPIYGKQWKDWNGVDQIKNLIESLKENPHGRRHLVSAWNVSELPNMTLPPCHYGFQCYVDTNNKLSLKWNQRSVDVFLGLPFNIASYGTLLMLLAHETGLEPGTLIGSLGDCHIYNNHIDQAKEQLERVGYPLPELKLSNIDVLGGEFDYELIDYNSHPTIKAPLNN